MLSANEARIKTIQAREGCTAKDLAVIEQAINEAIENGEFSVSLRSAIKPAAKEKLEMYGYEVAYGEEYNETFTTIRWFKA